MIKEIYSLRKDLRRIKILQEASLAKTNYGLKMENDLLFGTPKWFDAIDAGQIKKYSVQGVISNVFMSGHNDFPQFEIESEEKKTTWERVGIDEAYVIGRNVEIIYVEQKYKRPSDYTGVFSKCIILINVDYP